MIIKFIPLLLLFIGGLILTVGDIIMKQWIVTQNYYWYWFGIAIYLVSMNFLAHSFRFKNIAIASVIFVLFNIITLSFVSWFYFKEKMNILSIFGLILGLVAITVLEICH